MARQHHLITFCLHLLLMSFSMAAVDDDAAVMSKLLKSISDPPSTWKTEKHFCEWEGITCDDSSTRVTSINLADKSLSGTLPPDLNKLSHLETLDLQNNQFNGSLPTLANLTLLHRLNLNDNTFTSIPHQDDFFFGLSSLQYFDISDNSDLDAWVLPNNLPAQCSNLRSFNASDASLTGSIPESFTSLPHLQDLILSFNNLNGSLPSHLNNLSQLITLDLESTSLSGPLPTLANLTLLQQVSLSSSGFDSIPPDFFRGLSNLRYLDLSDNPLAPWILPNDITRCTKLQEFIAVSANIMGPIPDTFDRLYNLQKLSVSDNNLSGSLPSHLNNLSKLNTIDLSNNSFSGVLPTLANLRLLEEVSLEYNNFTSIPSDFFLGLTNLNTFRIYSNSDLEPWVLPYHLNQSTKLKFFDADSANIMGSIPEIFHGSRSLGYLYLSHNNLTGTLPASFAESTITNLRLNNQMHGLSGTLDVISRMTQLTVARLEANEFSGPIPDLTRCIGLTNLQLGDNQLTGLVHSSLTDQLSQLTNISLQNNRLQGPLPVFRETVESRLDNNSFCIPTGGDCDPQVTALLEVARDLGYPMSLAESWKGNDACRGWKFITCDSSRKNVTVVNFGKCKFSGTISPSFAKLTRLRNLSLNDNNLTGSIPENLASLEDLLLLDVSNNNLTGSIPINLTSLLALQLLDVSNNNLSGNIPKFPPRVKFLHNNTLLGKQSSSRNNRSLSIIIGSVIVSVFTLAGIVLLVAYKCYGVSRKSRIQITENYGEIPISESGKVMISMQLLEQVTDSFSDNNVLGRGGFGTVYKGELHDGTTIAVKKMISDVNGTQGIKEFHAEIGVLTKVRHRHLVALLGYCINDNERLLVYEYMPQGTLSQHLFKWREHKSEPLSWNQRVAIALDVGRGVEYMHNLAQQSFIHRDLKPANILLDDDMRAKVADFGLVKNAPDGKYSIETRLAGTFGYLAPEYAATGRVTTKVDVFAFGVVLMQLITGRKALDGSMPNEKGHLVTWFRRIPVYKENMVKFIDQVLDTDDSETLYSILKVAELARHCTAPEPFQRPNMGYVVGVLAHLVEEWNPSRQEEDKTYGHKHRMSLPELLQDDEDSLRILNLFRLSSF
uniref:receptor-like kinase TMK4 n=1 Tax=Erigeron canadensis TaxID=72917 RepID=UPI001CB94CCD|nr:receptor-like kinase TMK4 [Erigeron canadensis]